MEKKFICNADWPVAETPSGKIRGFFFDAVYHFRGIRYAQAERFQQPKPIAPWEGIKDALVFGHNCPGSHLPCAIPKDDLLNPRRFWPESEHCQYLNIWTNTLDKAAKKAVMVWLHGGGYQDGSSIELLAYDGDSLAGKDDVVVVSLNHRLNVLGFLDMSDYGPQYENSCNAGLADIVMALQWIHDNIEAFGGDPDRVTIFGQSGGGGKVSALMQIPAAAGLFSRAVVMSGIIPDDNMLCDCNVPAKRFVQEIMKELGLKEDALDAFLTAPEILLERAAERAQISLGKQGYTTGWGPRNNGWYQGSLVLNSITEFSRKIPTLVGTAFAEFNVNPCTLDKEALSEEARVNLVKQCFGEKAEGLLAHFQKAYPLVNTAYAYMTDTFFRKDTMEYVLKKAGQSEAPVYNYIFALPNALNGGTIAAHSADIPFAFHNADRIPVCQVEGVSDRMNDGFAGMMAAFAKTGNPNTAAFPVWEPCTGEHIRTMIFDRETTFREDHDRELIPYIIENTPAMHINFHAEEPAGVRWNY